MTTRLNYALGHGPHTVLTNRLYSKLIIDTSGCLLWTGYTDQHGYGRISINGKQMRVFRVMYELFVGPIPNGLEPDHLCRVRRCAAPAHLELVTHRENGLRGIGPTAVNARKYYCDSGHEFTPENTYIRPNGNRDCRACIRNWAAAYKARKDAA